MKEMYNKVEKIYQISVWLSFSFIGFVLGNFSQNTYGQQSTANYTFATNATGALTDMSSGATQIVGASQDNGASVVTNIGFDFWLMGTRYSQFSANSNGMIRLGGTAILGATADIPNTNNAVISPFCADLKTGSDGNVRYKVIGSSPSRCLVVEFYNMMLHYGISNAPGTGTYQARLYESTGVVEFVYGTMARNNNTPSNSTVNIGFSINTTSYNLVTVNTTTHTINTTSVINNTYTASQTITDLNSSSDGSRRCYTFTPPAPNAAPTNLTFSGVSYTGMTLNWTDNATDELGYVIYRSDDGGVTYNYITQRPANATSYTESSVNAGTTYYWKVYAVREGALSSALTGSQATPSGTTYTWTGSTNNTYYTATNWYPPRNTPASQDILIVDGDTTSSPTITAMPTQTIGQLKIINNANVNLQTSSVNTLTISGGGGTDLVIESGSTLNLSGTVGIAIAFAATAPNVQTGTIAGTLSHSTTSNSTTVPSFANSVTTVTGTLNLSSGVTGANAVVISSASSLIFASGSNCNKTTNNTFIPIATWNSNSNLNFTGFTNSSGPPTNNTQNFGNILYNCTGATATMSFLATSSASIAGNLTIQSTGSGKFRAVTTGTLNIGGNLVVTGGYLDVSNNGGPVSVLGNFEQSGGTVDIASSGTNATLKIKGSFNQSGGTLTESSGSTASNVEFNGTTSQSVIIANPANITNNVNFKVSNPAGIAITGTLPLNAGTTFTAAANGTAVTSGTVAYSTTTTLSYITALGAQTTGNEFPLTNGPVNLIINNSSSGSPNNRVTMNTSGNRTLAGNYTQTAGILLLGNNDLTVTGTISGTASNTNFVATNGTGQLRKTYSTAGSTTFPLGDITGTDEASAVTVNYTALTGASTVGIKVTDAQHPQDASTTNYLSRYYSFTESGATSYTYTLTLNYQAGDVVGTVGQTRINKWNGTDWFETSTTTPGATSVGPVAGLTSATNPLNGIDYTLRGIVYTYTWKGGTNSTYNTDANWYPPRSTPTNYDILQFNGSNIDGAGGTGAITATAVQTETIGKLVLLNNANVTFQTSGQKTLTIAGGTGTDLDIPSGSTLQLGSTGTNSVSIVYSGLQTATIAGTLSMLANTNLNNNYTATNSVTTVTGIISNSGGTVTSTTSNLSFNAASKYISNINGASIPTASWDALSTLQIDADIDDDEFSEEFGNVTVNAGSFTMHTSAGDFTRIIKGNMTINSGTVYVKNNGYNAALTINGNLTLAGGALVINSSNSSTANMLRKVTVMGDYSQTSGTFWISNNSSTGILSSDNIRAFLEVEGNFTHSGGFFGEDAADDDYITKLYLNGATSKTFSTINQSGNTEIVLNKTGTATNNIMSLDNNTIINHKLTLTDGLLSLLTYNLTIDSNATIIAPGNSSSMIVPEGTGELRKIFKNNYSFTYPVGSNTSSTVEYSPCILSFTQGTYSAGAYVGVRLANFKHPDNTSTTDYITRYWSLTYSGISSFKYSGDFIYVDSDINGTESNLYGRKYLSGQWLAIPVVNSSSNTFSKHGLSSFGDFTAGDKVCNPVTPAQSAQYTPNPNALNQPLNGNLIWYNDSTASSYDVYFGITNPPPFTTNISANSSSPINYYNYNVTSYGQDYYWRIDIKNHCGTTTGSVRKFTTAENLTFSATNIASCGTNYGNGVGNGDTSLVPAYIYVSGLPTGGLSATGTMLRQVNIQLGNHSVPCKKDLSTYKLKLRDPNGVSIILADPITTSTGDKWINIKYRDESSLERIEEYTSTGQNNYYPYSIGYYAIENDGDFSDFNTGAKSNPNGKWRLDVLENATTGTEISFERVDLIFGPPIQVNDVTNNSLNNSCSNATCADGVRSIRGTNLNYGNNDPNYPGNNFDGCDWNGANNNSAWFYFIASANTTQIIISGNLNTSSPGDADQQAVVVVAPDNCTIPTDVVYGGCPNNWSETDNNLDYWTSNGGGFSSHRDNIYVNGISFNHEFNLTGLIIGRKYYIYIDGNGGTPSTFYIEISSQGCVPCEAHTLPVDLISFDAGCHSNQSVVTWSTATETNNDYFILERSFDLVSWEIITKINGAGNSNMIQSYQYSDKIISDSDTYYRLTQTDFDGHSETFGPISLSCNNNTDKSNKVQYYPIPFSSELKVKLQNMKAENANISIYNNLGNVVFNTNLTNEQINSQNIKINLQHLETGVYIIKFQSQYYNQTDKILKK